MKKTILSIAAVMMMSSSAFAQSYVQASGNDGFTYDCDEVAPTGISWSNYFPTCAGVGGNGGGGWDAAPVNELKFGWGQSAAGRVYDFIAFAVPLNLSASAAVQTIKVDLKNTLSGNPAPLTYQVWLERGFNENSVAMTDEINLAVTGTYTTFLVDFSTHIKSGEDLSVVDKIVFKYDNCPTHITTNGDFFMKNFVGGSLVVTGLNNSTSVADANVFPNPSTGQTTVSGELKSVADVKITLVDILGQEVKVIAEERTSTINSTFDVSNLKKGIYTVVTNIDGAPAKSQMLVVR